MCISECECACVCTCVSGCVHVYVYVCLHQYVCEMDYPIIMEHIFLGNPFLAKSLIIFFLKIRAYFWVTFWEIWSNLPWSKLIPPYHNKNNFFETFNGNLHGNSNFVKTRALVTNWIFSRTNGAKLHHTLQDDNIANRKSFWAHHTPKRLEYYGGAIMSIKLNTQRYS